MDCRGKELFESILNAWKQAKASPYQTFYSRTKIQIKPLDKGPAPFYNFLLQKQCFIGISLKAKGSPEVYPLCHMAKLLTNSGRQSMPERYHLFTKSKQIIPKQTTTKKTQNGRKLKTPSTVAICFSIWLVHCLLNQLRGSHQQQEAFAQPNVTDLESSNTGAKLWMLV